MWKQFSILKYLIAISFYCQWVELIYWKRYSWTNFCFLRLSIEVDRIVKHTQIDFGILGFTGYVIISPPETQYIFAEEVREIKKRKRK